MNVPNYSKITRSIDEKIILTVFFSLLVSIQIFAQPGRLDLNFLQVLLNDANVSAIETQPDGKILIAGIFASRSVILRRDIVRLNADGSLDSTFSAGSGANNSGLIRFIKLQTDGKIIIAGNFTQINGEFRRAIARLNPNGSIDTTFNVSGIDVSFVNDLDVQTDGKILISAQNSTGNSFVARLNTNGSNDSGVDVPLFQASGGFNYRVSFVPTENKILVGGNFSYTVNQTAYKNLARLNLDGTIDSTFTTNVTNATFDLLINIKPIGGGKILIFGRFDSVNQTTRRNIAILNNDGSLDVSFNPATSGTEIFISVAVQTNGKIIVGGVNFSSNTFVRGNVARLNADGSVDTTFNQGKGANADVRALNILSNDKLLIGGTFSKYHIFPRTGLAQINL